MNIHFHIPVWLLWSVGGFILGYIICGIVVRMAVAKMIGGLFGW